MDHSSHTSRLVHDSQTMMESLQSLWILVIFSLSLPRVSACIPSGFPGVTDVDGVEEQVCNGSLHLISTDRNVTLHTSDYAIDTYKNLDEPIQISSAKTQGCGCFIIWTKKKERGEAKEIFENKRFDSNDRDFVKNKIVKSITRIECPQAE